MTLNTIDAFEDVEQLLFFSLLVSYEGIMKREINVKYMVLMVEVVVPKHQVG